MAQSKHETFNKLTSKEWFPNDLLKSAVPILEDPGLTTNDVKGTGFLVRYGNVNYVVTNRHVIDNLKNPMIGYHIVNSDEPLQQVSTDKLSKIAHLTWINHPDGLLDLVAIPFSIQDNMDVKVIPESNWDKVTNMDKGDDVAHIGYPQGVGASYADGSKGFFAVVMPGKVSVGNENRILTQTNGQEGASGGPLFLKNKSGECQLIGIASIAMLTGNYQYQNKTASIPIYEIKKIFESESMKEQVNQFEKLVRD